MSLLEMGYPKVQWFDLIFLTRLRQIYEKEVATFAGTIGYIIVIVYLGTGGVSNVQFPEFWMWR